MNVMIHTEHGPLGGLPSLSLATDRRPHTSDVTEAVHLQQILLGSSILFCDH